MRRDEAKRLLDILQPIDSISGAALMPRWPGNHEVWMVVARYKDGIRVSWDTVGEFETLGNGQYRHVFQDSSTGFWYGWRARCTICNAPLDEDGICPHFDEQRHGMAERVAELGL